MNLRRVRRSRDLTQAQLAERVGVSAQLICKLEMGVARPSLDLAVSIARVLEADATTLFVPFVPANSEGVGA